MDAQVYRQLARIEGKHWWFEGRRAIVSRLLSGLALPRDARILEVGSGTGGNTDMLRAFGDVVCVEPNESARVMASEKTGTEALDGALPNRLPAGLGHFDLIVALDVLEHIDDDRASLGVLKDHLKPGGFGVFTVPAFRFLWSAHDLTHHHKRRYTKRDLVAAVRSAGLVPVRTSYFNFWLFPLVVLVRFLKRLTGSTSSDDTLRPRFANAILKAVINSEKHLVGHVPVPPGSSLIMLATRPQA